MKKLLSILTTAATLAGLTALTTLAGCNTMEGVGKDVQKGGEAIENAASKAKS